MGCKLFKFVEFTIMFMQRPFCPETPPLDRIYVRYLPFLVHLVLIVYLFRSSAHFHRLGLHPRAATICSSLNLLMCCFDVDYWLKFKFQARQRLHLRLAFSLLDTAVICVISICQPIGIEPQLVNFQVVPFPRTWEFLLQILECLPSWAPFYLTPPSVYLHATRP